jgi:hypothetical protein
VDVPDVEEENVEEEKDEHRAVGRVRVLVDVPDVEEEKDEPRAVGRRRVRVDVPNVEDMKDDVAGTEAVVAGAVGIGDKMNVSADSTRTIARRRHSRRNMDDMPGWVGDVVGPMERRVLNGNSYYRRPGDAYWIRRNEFGHVIKLATRRLNSRRMTERIHELQSREQEERGEVRTRSNDDEEEHEQDDVKPPPKKKKKKK